MFENAKSTLVYYITMCMENAGLSVDSDNRAEIECIFDYMDNDIRKLVREEIERSK